MNKYIKLISFVLLFVIILSASSCFFDVYRGPYIFWRQDRSNIEKIEICSYDKSSGTRSVIAELPKEATDEIIDEISTYQCYEIPPEHPREISSIILCVTYLDGVVDIISFCAFSYMSPNEKICDIKYELHSDYMLPLYKLMCRYVEESLIIDIKNQYPLCFVEESSSN